MRKASAALLTGGKRLLSSTSVAFSLRTSQQKLTPSPLQVESFIEFDIVSTLPYMGNAPGTLLQWLSCVQGI